MGCCEDFTQFRHRIVIQSLSLTPTDSGGETESWSTYTNAWAMIQPVIKEEQLVAQRIEPFVDHKIRMRYQAGITATMRIVFGSRTFQIKAVINEFEDSRFLTILARENSGT